MTKKELRKEMILKMKNFSKNILQKDRADAMLLEKLVSTTSYQNAKIVATYLSMVNEFNTNLFISQAIKDKKTVVIPKTYPNGKMIFVKYDKNQLQKTSFGLLEPISDLEVKKSEIDFIHVPGVVFSPDGYRIGYGAGYFDRYLADYTGDTISTIYPFQLQDFKKEPFDIPVRKLLQ
ncbi:5-formyltetrahydrofolate cyclo-ligase [Streptococcus thoraltensis]|uniref:5-formyltetrahydrofolate cyclo-ligase n=1 Tax=Streptococcus thoraltensis TaxID=55085 RepID=UPI001F5A804B|nr:5-formyltetrahydrofolate cyclo-ligase [Streptococcus thoraltensis]